MHTQAEKQVGTVYLTMTIKSLLGKSLLRKKIFGQEADKK